jgi:S-adenosyl-L-methionine hydrolase (adenosine-forming)
MTRTIIFMSDLGLRDELVGVCHLVMNRIAPEARIVDLSHGLPPQNIQAGAMVISHALPYMDATAIVLAVVDPGTGARRALAVETRAGRRLVGPDNGLLSLAWQADGGVARAVEIDPRAVGTTTVSPVFHARDLFAPAAARLAAGMPLEDIGPVAEGSRLVVLSVEAAEAEPGRVHGQVLDVDRFGNIRLNVRPPDLERAGFRVGTTVEIATTGISIRARRITAYGDVPPGEYGLLVDAWEWAAIIRFEASAAAAMGVTRGDPVWIAAAN